MTSHVQVERPSLINALIPNFIKNLVRSGATVAFLFVAIVLFEYAGYIGTIENKAPLMIGVLVVVGLVPLLSKFCVLISTKYYFHKTHVTKEFSFIVVKKESIPYSQILTVTLDVGLWDRMCKAGAITVHTADDTTPDLVLEYLRNPVEIEKKIHAAMHHAHAQKHAHATPHPHAHQGHHPGYH